MKRVFLDTNILMDIAESREHAPEANLLLDYALNGIIRACVAPVTYTTISFLLHRYDKEQIHEYLRLLSDGIEILPMDASQFQLAMAFGPVRDFEDIPFPHRSACYCHTILRLQESMRLSLNHLHCFDCSIGTYAAA